MLLYSESRSGAPGSTVQGRGGGLCWLTYLLRVNHVWPWPPGDVPCLPLEGMVTCGYQAGCQPRAYPWGVQVWRVAAPSCADLWGDAGGPAAAGEAEGRGWGRRNGPGSRVLPAGAAGLGVKG